MYITIDLDADQIMRVLTWLDNYGYVKDFETSLENELPIACTIL